MLVMCVDAFYEAIASTILGICCTILLYKCIFIPQKVQFLFISPIHFI